MWPPYGLNRATYEPHMATYGPNMDTYGPHMAAHGLHMATCQKTIIFLAIFYCTDAADRTAGPRRKT